MAHHESTRVQHRRCAHAVGHPHPQHATRHSPIDPTPHPAVTHAEACLLFHAVSELIPAPTPGLARDTVAWAAFEDLLDEAAAFVVDALGPRGAASVRSLAPALEDAGPVQGALVALAIGRLGA